MRDGASPWFMHGSSFTKLPSGLTLWHLSRNKPRVERKVDEINPTLMLKKVKQVVGLGIHSDWP
jgi:hypothetical protein